jgi:hypothetical protein
MSGMMMCNLQVLNFSGEPPSPRQCFGALSATFCRPELFSSASFELCGTKTNLPGTIVFPIRISVERNSCQLEPDGATPNR